MNKTQLNLSYPKLYLTKLYLTKLILPSRNNSLLN